MMIQSILLVSLLLVLASSSAEFFLVSAQTAAAAPTSFYRAFYEQMHASTTSNDEILRGHHNEGIVAIPTADAFLLPVALFNNKTHGRTERTFLFACVGPVMNSQNIYLYALESGRMELAYPADTPSLLYLPNATALCWINSGMINCTELARLGDPATTQQPYPTTVFRAPVSSTISWNIAFHDSTGDLYFINENCIKRLHFPDGFGSVLAAAREDDGTSSSSSVVYGAQGKTMNQTVVGVCQPDPCYSSANETDGIALDTKLITPIGLTVSDDGKYIFFTEFNPYRLRVAVNGFVRTLTTGLRTPWFPSYWLYPELPTSSYTSFKFLLIEGHISTVHLFEVSNTTGTSACLANAADCANDTTILNRWSFGLGHPHDTSGKTRINTRPSGFTVTPNKTGSASHFFVAGGDGVFATGCCLPAMVSPSWWWKEISFSNGAIKLTPVCSVASSGICVTASNMSKFESRIRNSLVKDLARLLGLARSQVILTKFLISTVSSSSSSSSTEISFTCEFQVVRSSTAISSLQARQSDTSTWLTATLATLNSIASTPLTNLLAAVTYADNRTNNNNDNKGDCPNGLIKGDCAASGGVIFIIVLLCVLVVAGIGFVYIKQDSLFGNGKGAGGEGEGEETKKSKEENYEKKENQREMNAAAAATSPALTVPTNNNNASVRSNNVEKVSVSSLKI